MTESEVEPWLSDPRVHMQGTSLYCLNYTKWGGDSQPAALQRDKSQVSQKDRFFQRTNWCLHKSSPDEEAIINKHKPPGFSDWVSRTPPQKVCQGHRKSEH